MEIHTEKIMKKRVLLAVFLTLCLGVVEWPGVRGADGDVKKSEPGTDAADEALLKTAGLTGDGQALLDFFRQRTVQRVDPAKIKSLINQLDDESFQVREQASAEL